MYLVFTRMPGKGYRRLLTSLLLCLCDIYRLVTNSLVCRHCVLRLLEILSLSLSLSIYIYILTEATLSLSLSLSLSLYIYIYIYIYRERERERERVASVNLQAFVMFLQDGKSVVQTATFW